MGVRERHGGMQARNIASWLNNDHLGFTFKGGTWGPGGIKGGNW
jgi:hypothetical protein